MKYVLIGIRQGFHSGFNRKQRLQNATNNLPNQEYLAREISLNRTVKLSEGIWPSGTYITENLDNQGSAVQHLHYECMNRQTDKQNSHTSRICRAHPN